MDETMVVQFRYEMERMRLDFEYKLRMIQLENQAQLNAVNKVVDELKQKIEGL